MSRIVLPPRWQKPPIGAQIDSSHPLAAGLVGCWLMAEGTGKTAWDSAGNNQAATWNTASKVSWLASAKGQSINLDGTAGSWLNVPDSPIHRTLTTLTVLIRVKPAAASVANAILISRYVTSDALATFQILRNVATTQITHRLGYTANNLAIVGTASVFDGLWHDVVLTYDGQVARAYVDGNPDGSSTNAQTLATGAAPIQIGTRASGSLLTTGQYAHAMIWNRALGAGDIRKLTTAPYELLTGNWLTAVIPFTSPTATPTDSLAGAETISPMTATTITESLAALESLASTSGLSVADTAAVVEALAQTLGMAPSEVLSLGDALTLAPQLAGSVTDALAGLESTAPELAQNHTSRLNPNDVLVQAGGAVIVDGVSVADTFTVFVPLAPFGAYRVLTVNISRTQIAMGDAMYTVAGNPALTDIRQGDSYSFNLSGTLGIPGTIAAARVMFKTNRTDADADALIDVTLTSSISSNGQIVTNGAAGPYSVNVDLLPAQTRALVNAANVALPWYGWYELRLTNAGATQEYTPLTAQLAKASPRLINAS